MREVTHERRARELMREGNDARDLSSAYDLYDDAVDEAAKIDDYEREQAVIDDIQRARKRKEREA